MSRIADIWIVYNPEGISGHNRNTRFVDGPFICPVQAAKIRNQANGHEWDYQCCFFLVTSKRDMLCQST